MYPDGRVDAWQNQPTNGDPARPAWLPQTRYNPVATGVGAARDNIRFADIDGDGRADYLAVDPDTGRTWWNRNPISRDTGPNAASPIWDGQVLIAGGVDGPGTQLRYADLNGDGRAEYIMINKDTSAARVYFNGCNAA